MFMKNSILIVEDHELTRFGLKTAFEACDYVEIIHEAEHPQALHQYQYAQEQNLGAHISQ